MAEETIAGYEKAVLKQTTLNRIEKERLELLSQQL